MEKGVEVWTFLRFISGLDTREDWEAWKKELRRLGSLEKGVEVWTFLGFVSCLDTREDWEVWKRSGEDWEVWKKELRFGLSSGSFRVSITEKIGKHGKRSGGLVFPRVHFGSPYPRRLGSMEKGAEVWTFLRFISGLDNREDWEAWKKELRFGLSSGSFRVSITEKIGKYGKRSGGLDFPQVHFGSRYPRRLGSMEKGAEVWTFLRFISGLDNREDWEVWKKEWRFGLSSGSFRVSIPEKIGKYGKGAEVWTFLRFISGLDNREDWEAWKKERRFGFPQVHFGSRYPRRLGSMEKGAEVWTFLRFISGLDNREDWEVWKKERRRLGSMEKGAEVWTFLRFISGLDNREDWEVWKKERRFGLSSGSFRVSIPEKIGKYGKRSGGLDFPRVHFGSPYPRRLGSMEKGAEVWTFLRFISGLDNREDWEAWKKELRFGLSSGSFRVSIPEKIGKYGKGAEVWTFLRFISGLDTREDWEVWKKERRFGLSSGSFRVSITEKIGKYGKRSGGLDFPQVHFGSR
ncbi:hypothetical protein ACOME3_005562 [Neoechinorhynchus agilis]